LALRGERGVSAGNDGAPRIAISATTEATRPNTGKSYYNPSLLGVRHGYT
jgi:hypothetical protein